MKQVLQDLRTGQVIVADVPRPTCGAGQLLISTSRSLISTGTERMIVEFGRAGWIEKARKQPDKVRMVVDKVMTDGLLPTIEAVRSKLDRLVALGYCNVGTVREIGKGAIGFALGDRVVSNGHHAELVNVPRNLCAIVPDSVSDEQAAFTVVGAIALQGIRLVQPTLGETVAVTGLGLIGLLTVQLLRAHGCEVLGIDLDPSRLAMARQFGVWTVDLSGGEDPVEVSRKVTRGRGIDACIVTASTQSSEPISQAAAMCRKRGRIVLVGVTGLQLSRADFYEKELTFQVSCSYGPGRYDPAYEQAGHDYPLGFVRWTEQRNFEAVLAMMAERRIDPVPLITHRFALDQAADAYRLIASDESSLGVVLDYGPDEGRCERSTMTVSVSSASTASSAGVVGFIGAGAYADGKLIPAFRRGGARLRSVASQGGLSAYQAGRKHGIEEATTDVERVLADADLDTVVISTRHDSHARLTCAALRAGKHVFVEKPLAITSEDLDEIEVVYRERVAAGSPPLLMVGFNRRFSKHVQAMKTLLDSMAAPKAFVITVNAGALPATHWTQEPAIGGGRIVGEACHFIDLLRFLAASEVIERRVMPMRGVPNGPMRADTAALTLRFKDGSLGAIHYLANGHRSFPKERVEVFCGGRILQLDNLRLLTGYGWPHFRRLRSWTQDKGAEACVAAFLEAIRTGGPSPIPFEEIMQVSRIAVELGEAAQ